MMKDYYTDYSFVHVFTDYVDEEIRQMEFVSDEEAREYLNENQ